MKLTIAQRLLFTLVGLTILPLALLDYAVQQAFESAITRTTVQKLSEIADKKSIQISDYVEERLLDVRNLGQSRELANDLLQLTRTYRQGGPNGAGYQQAVRELGHRYQDYIQRNGYYDLFLVDLSGEVVFTVKQETDFATNLRTGPYRESELGQVFHQTATLLGAEISHLQYYPPSSEVAAFIAAPILHDNQLLGVVALQINTDHFYSVIRDHTGLGVSGATLIGRKDGDDAVFLVQGKEDPHTPTSQRMALHRQGAKPLQKSVIGDQGAGVTVDYRGIPVVAAWRYIPDLRVGMVVKIDAEEAFAQLHTLRLSGWAFGAFLSLAVLVAAWRQGQHILKPIQELTRVTAVIAGGNLQERVQRTTHDEIGQLGRAFNTMADHLLCATNSLETRVRERTHDLQLQVAERIKAQERLRLAGIVFDNTSEGVVVTDAHSRILDVNPAFCRISGYSREEVLGNTPGMTKSGRHDATFYQEMWSTIQQTGQWNGEIWDRRKNGELYPKWLSINTVRDEQGQPSHYVGIFSDITHIKQTAEQLEQLAFYDTLTSLPNRALFHNRLSHELSVCRRYQLKLGLMFLDLDRFKHVNDTLGHHAGDLLLQEVARRLLQQVRDTDTVSRLGGDEFTLILTDIQQANDMAPLAQFIIHAISQPITLQGQEVYVGASIGLAVFPEDGDTPETLIKNADMAMYQAKGSGRNTFHFFSAQLHALAFDRITLEDDLHKALDREELLLYYQPKVRLEDGVLTGMEALLRWRKPDKGMISPGKFIPLAEETGIILPIGQWVTNTAFRQAAAWGAMVPGLNMAINLSARQFHQKNLIEMVRNSLLESRVDPTTVELEITESMVMGDVNKAIATMKALRDLGLNLAMDDFGTGYSSLSYLKQFPINTLKIDQSFVRDIPQDHQAIAIVQAIIAMATSLNLHVVAEGVETPQQAAFLRRHGCALVQGYLFSRPLPADEFERLARSGNPFSIHYLN